ncbi:MFS transporter [Vulgatibacter sp.]|uniref:MFS transporter n=1 Tax=Vulgatibacter sp. TaxID=1971226 RepID=UPI00356150A6
MRISTERWVLAATILGSSMVFIDGTVVNVALPAIQQAFDATVGDLQWVVESYALLLAALILVGGALGDKVGRRRIFVAGLVLFAGASLWCGLSPSVEQLILARAVQGIGGALLAPASLAIIAAEFPDEEARGKAIGTWSGFTAITTAIGPLLGGWLVDNASWRWAFLINLPIALVVGWITLRHVPESRDRRAGAVDWPGGTLAALALGALVYGLVTAGERGFARPEVVVALLAAGIAGAAFVWREKSAHAPMVPFGLFRSRNFSGANALTLLLYGALYGILFFFPLVFIQVHGYSATAAGAAIVPFAALLFLLSRWAGGLVGKVGPRLPLVVGPSITGVGFFLFSLPGLGGSYWTTFFPAVLLVGIGMGVTVAPLTTTVMTSVEERHAGLASGINNAVSRVAAVLAIAVLGAIAAASFGPALQERIAPLDLPPAAAAQIRAQENRLAEIEVPQTLQPATQAQVEEAIDRSFVGAFRIVCWICAGLAFGSAAFAGLILEKRRRRGRENLLATCRSAEALAVHPAAPKRHPAYAGKLSRTEH